MGDVNYPPSEVPEHYMGPYRDPRHHARRSGLDRVVCRTCGIIGLPDHEQQQWVGVDILAMDEAQYARWAAGEGPNHTWPFALQRIVEQADEEGVSLVAKPKPAPEDDE